MVAGKDLTTEVDIKAALERARDEPPLPAALSANYNSELDAIVIRVDDGRRLLIPREEMQGLEDATEDQIAEIEIFGGLDIAWPQLDVDHYLPHLLEGRYSTEKWKQMRGKVVAA